LTPRQTVLVVDPSEETREVLRAALAARGVAVYGADRASQVAAVAAQVEPDVIVIDLEAEPLAAATGRDDLSTSAPIQPAMVLLGTARRQAPAHLSGEFVAKPYHYAPLIRRIEALLEQSQTSSATGRRAAA
jgi:DNA-binding response OmpR family regulator